MRCATPESPSASTIRRKMSHCSARRAWPACRWAKSPGLFRRPRRRTDDSTHAVRRRGPQTGAAGSVVQDPQQHAICFVSIFERVQGPNAVYNPWEGQGAQAIIAGANAVRRGEVPCALVGGCDVKTHELSFIAMQQNGVFRSWQECGSGPIPGEGAAFLVLEDEERARSRGAHAHARLSFFASRTAGVGMNRADVYADVFRISVSALSGSSSAPPMATFRSRRPSGGRWT